MYYLSTIKDPRRKYFQVPHLVLNRTHLIIITNMSYQSFVLNFTMAGPGSTPNDILDVLSAIDKSHPPPMSLTSSLAASSTRVIDHPHPLIPLAPIQRPHPSQVKRSSPQPLPIIGLGLYLDGEVCSSSSFSPEEDDHRLFSQPLLPTRRSSPNRIEGILDDGEEEWDSIPARMRASSHHFDAPPAEDLPIPFFFDAPLSELSNDSSEESSNSSLGDNSVEDSPITSEDEDEFSFGIDIFSPIPSIPHSYSSTDPICIFVDTRITTVTEDLDLAIMDSVDSDNVTLTDILHSLLIDTYRKTLDGA
ncbi:hypothetical protein C8Q75DRAFT_385596 [Abortiporus biennis]|nr:hypothetical protein C8Q75DRAFT_385596 [Abortiporus biennis]